MRRLLFTVLVATAAGCTHGLDGPTPEPTGLANGLVCVEQVDRTVTLTGKGFTPLATKALEATPVLVLPKVTLVRAKDLAGAAAAGLSRVLADDPAQPGKSAIGWTSQEAMTLKLTPALKLEPGLYDVTVENPNGATGTLAGALLAVPRPTLTKVVPEALCSDAAASLRLEGSGFLKLGDLVPAVKIGDSSFTAAADGCVALPGKSGAQACTALTITVPKSTLAAATLDVTVTNPEPAACHSTDATVKLVVVPPPTITGTSPTKICRSGGTLTITGTGFREGSTAKLGTVAATTVDVASATQVSASFGPGLEAPGPFDLTITTPEQCSATLAASVSVVDGAQLFFVDPPVAWNGIRLQLTAYGTALDTTPLKVELVKPDGTSVELDETPVSASRLRLELASGLPVGDYGLRVTDGIGCAATLDKAIKVVSETTLDVASVNPGFGWKDATTGITVTLDTGSEGKFEPVPRLYLTPHTPGADTHATPLGAVDLVSDTSLTSMVPAGLAPGSYDLVIVNPDGSVGVKENAFVVTNDAPPTIIGVAPGSVPRSGTQAFTIEGAAFRNPAVRLDCSDSSATGGRRIITPTLAGGGTSTRLQVSFDTTLVGTTPSACVVRVTNQETGTPFVDFSALVITNPAENLGDSAVGPTLVTARRALGLGAVRLSNAARFLVATGGDAGGELTAMATVESAPINVYGEQGTWTAQRHEMTAKRTYHGTASLGRFVYAIGGSSGTAALQSVERAAILDPAASPQVGDLELSVVSENGLNPGIWTYRVAAVMDANDRFNPGGEGLASERFPVSLPTLTPARLFRIKVRWSAVPGATSYRVYRSATANAPASQEKLIGTVAATTRELDDTGLAAGTEVPLPIGSLGTWHTVTQLTVPRRGAAVALVRDLASSDATFPQVWWLHALAGTSTTGASVTSTERLRIELAADGSQTLGTAWVAGPVLPTARWQARAFVGTSENSRRIAEAFPGVKKAFVWVGPGLGDGVAANVTQAAEVQADGSLGTFKVVKQTSGASYGAVFAGNFLYTFGGGSTTDNGSNQGEICGAGVGGCNTTPAPPDLRNWNSAATLHGNRTASGTLLEGATIYLVGGYNDDGTAATNSTEQLVW